MSDSLCGVQLLAGHRHLSREHIARIKTWPHVMQDDKAVNQQNCADQEYKRERDFADYQERAASAMAEASSPAAACFLQQCIQVGARRSERGEQTKQHSGKQ